MTAAVLLEVAVVALLSGARTHVLLHIFQQEHYEGARLRLWASQRRPAGWPLPPWAALAALAAPAAGAAISGVAGAAAGVIAAAYAGWVTWRTWRRPAVKPLVLTPRARRLFAVAVLLAAVPVAVLGLAVGGWAGLAAAAALGAVLVGGALHLLLLAERCLRPVQRLDNRRFVRRAQRRLAGASPLVVGITGSYGKTTTKACVAAVLDVLGPSYPTPASFNSYLGVVRAINEGLKDEHRSFVVEMGAYREGDVAELCELTRPTIGVLTAVGPAHLERFGSLDAIARAKGELAAALPPDGTFVTRGDDERLRRIAAERARCPTIFIGLAGGSGIDVWPENVRTTTGRTTFDLCIADGGEVLRAAVRTRLLGGHNVANLLAAAAVGHAGGLEVTQIAAALSRVRPPAHRLEPIANAASGVVVIDDSYNSNPAGAASAIDVLAQHPAERRILVTPGMVELGELEEEENRRLGERAAAVCDRVIVIGATRGARAVEEGLRAGGLDGDRIVVAPDGPAAHQIIATETRRGDVILFENDVPDVYVTTPPR